MNRPTEDRLAGAAADAAGYVLPPDFFTSFSWIVRANQSLLGRGHDYGAPVGHRRLVRGRGVFPVRPGFVHAVIRRIGRSATARRGATSSTTRAIGAERATSSGWAAVFFVCWL